MYWVVQKVRADVERNAEDLNFSIYLLNYRLVVTNFPDNPIYIFNSLFKLLIKTLVYFDKNKISEEH